eukprot:Skav221161  [mRNA]  locus=scaffold85:177089:185207:- [translate_table: standard]
MKVSGCPPDEVTYGIIINSLASQSSQARAQTFFRQAEQEGIQAFMEKIYSVSLKPNIISFNNLLSACAMRGSLSEARKVLETMNSASVAPDGFSYVWLIKAAAEQGGEAAERCLQEARQRDLQVGAGMYNAVFRAYLAEIPEKPQEVKRLFSEMQELNVQPNAWSYLAMANAYAMQNEVQLAEDLIFKARREGGDGPEFYACLLFAYARKRGSRSIKAERTFRELVAAGIRPSKQMLRYLRMAMDSDQADALLADLGLADLRDDAEKRPPFAMSVAPVLIFATDLSGSSSTLVEMSSDFYYEGTHCPDELIVQRRCWLWGCIAMMSPLIIPSSDTL